MPVPALIAVGVAANAATALLANGKANSMNSQLETLETNITNLANNRQEIPNLADNLTDLSGTLSNPFANLGVAMKSAEIQMEQTDLALANTLDTLRATGASAGGATALAREAARSKQNVAANIEQQEAQNQKLRAQGEQQLQQQVMQEKIRIQQGEMAADQFAFQAQETREMQELDRAQALYDNALAQQTEYQQAAIGALTGMAGSLTQLGGVLEGN
tara:strand:+ start:677 stop:1330 length:654 start_codon:yes stop_codon:yes gene_type:complete